jgi:hypothetical protein
MCRARNGQNSPTLPIIQADDRSPCHSSHQNSPATLLAFATFQQGIPTPPYASGWEGHCGNESDDDGEQARWRSSLRHHLAAARGGLRPGGLHRGERRRALRFVNRRERRPRSSRVDHPRRGTLRVVCACGSWIHPGTAVCHLRPPDSRRTSRATRQPRS